MQGENKNLVQRIESIIADILHLTQAYQGKQSKNTRKAKGQFFSSYTTARYMASLIPEMDQREIRILDPGAGNGLLGVCALARALGFRNVKKISLTFVENDRTILPILQRVKEQLDLIGKSDRLEINTTIAEENFILSTSDKVPFDIVICNPPYSKISKQASEATAMSEYVYGQPNIYALFVVKALRILSNNGRFVFITPRSWSAGDYFIRMRKYALQQALSHIHLFKTRENVFSSENVLQETMIWSGEKGEARKYLTVSTSEDDQFINMEAFTVALHDIVTREPAQCLLLPTSADDYALLRRMSVLCDTFDSLGYAFKTGPVVEFRSRDLVSVERKGKSIPMFRPFNIQHGKFVFPVAAGKAQYIITDNEPSLKIQNAPTVIVKRMSSKEEDRRLQCCKYYPIPNESFVSMENHVNFLVRKDGQRLSTEEVRWAYNIISSEEYDRYFRMVSGSTQVNARDLNTLPVPRR